MEGLPARIRARIAEIHPLTPSIKRFVLEYGEAPFSFEAGQWLDLFVRVEGQERIGGYSMTSSPSEQGRLELAIQASPSHPVTQYLHERAQVGEEVEICGGQGSLVFRPEPASPTRPPLLLLAGGIGITPLMSMFRRAAEFPGQKVTLIYSAKSPEAFAFSEEIRAGVRANPDLRAIFTVTGGEQGASLPSMERGWERGRISEGLLRRAELRPDTVAYLCGPSAFVDELALLLEKLGVPRQNVRFEKWW